MDYEKKYKEANDKVAARFGTNVAKEIFTDLYESEDEKIRKGILELVKQSSEILEKKNQEQMIAWLEKQGEQKPTDEEMKELLKTEYEKGREDVLSEIQKPTWSIEDESICNNIICDIANDKSICKYEISKGICDIQINWLKSLKQRIQHL